jgi:hypothetical protein
MHQKSADLHFDALIRPDYYLFPNPMKYLGGRKFFSIIEVTLAADKRFAAQPIELFFDGLKKLEQQTASSSKNECVTEGSLDKLHV